MPRMVSKYAGTCQTCGKRFGIGAEIWYGGRRNVHHIDCYRGKPKIDRAKADNPKPRKVEDGQRVVTEWADLRTVILDGFNGNYSHTKIPRNRQTIEYYTHRVSQSFTGYSMMQAKDWNENGYETDALRDLQDFAPPIREKRKFIYSDEGDEIDLSAAWSGEDNFMTEWTKRDSIPGIAIEFEICFVCSTPAKVVNAYLHWIAQAVYAIESAGIDPEISISNPLRADWTGGKRIDNLIRVKKEMETVDYASWSAMLSPAAFRTNCFISSVMVGESLGKGVDLGISFGHTGTSWNVVFDQDSGTIKTYVPYKPSGFPEESMTAQLRKAIDELRGKF